MAIISACHVMSPRRFARLSLYLLLVSHLALAEEMAIDVETDATNDLLPLSWEELTEQDVSSLSRQDQSVKDSPAAAFVITAEDIRRSGVTSVPELLRMVPGMNVARLNAWNWGVSARGFNDLYANKLQVMIDGRSIYDPLSSGVYWGQQNPSLPDIERIEVLRGPSGSLWGANAVNGTINIVTRSAKDTQGGLIYGGGGSEELGFGGVRYGIKLGETEYLRGTLNANARDASVDLLGNQDTHDYGNSQTGNFRFDSQVGERDQLMLEANVSRYRQHGYFIGKTQLSPLGWRPNDFGRDGVTGSLQGSWKHQGENGHDWQLNSAFIQTEWQLAMIKMARSQYNLDFHYSMPAFENHQLLWGLSYNAILDDFENSLTLGFVPAQFEQHNVGVFLQDRIELLDDLALILANRVEHFTFTGWETEPNARLLWTPDKQHSIWVAVSRAVVLPNRAQHGIHMLKPIPGLAGDQPADFFYAKANPNMVTENLLAFELGWRWQVNHNLSLDTALFYNLYDRMQGTVFTGKLTGADALLPGIKEATVANYRQVTSYGLELSANYRVNPDWRLQASYSANQYQASYDRQLRQRQFLDLDAEEHFNPAQSLSLRSLFNLTSEIEFDSWLRYVDEISPDYHRIPAYVSLDLRLGWHPHKDLELSLGGQNLLDSQHPEFSDVLYVSLPSQLQRAYLAQLSWRF